MRCGEGGDNPRGVAGLTVDAVKNGQHLGCEDMGFAGRTVIGDEQIVGGAHHQIAGARRNAGRCRQETRRPATDAKQVKPCVPRVSFLIYSTWAFHALVDSDCPLVIVMLGLVLVRISWPV